MSSYNRNQLLALRNSTLVASSNVASLIPTELQLCHSSSSPSSAPNATNENVKPVKTYSRLQLLRIRQQAEMNDADFDSTTSTSLPQASIPSELRRAPRFRCDSNCLNQEIHETKQILKYSRMELLRYRTAASAQSCAAQYINAMQATETKAPEIFRHLGH